MTHFKGKRFVSVFIALVAVFVLGQAVPAGAGGPPDVALNSKVQLNQAEQTGALNASKSLLQQHFGAEMAQNLATRADTKILRRTQNGYEGEMLVLGLEKANYTAKMSRLEFAVEGGQTKVKGIQKNYSPSFNEAPAPVPSNAQLQANKAKLNINKAGAAPADIKQFNAAAFIKRQKRQRRESPIIPGPQSGVWPIRLHRNSPAQLPIPTTSMPLCPIGGAGQRQNVSAQRAQRPRLTTSLERTTISLPGTTSAMA